MKGRGYDSPCLFYVYIMWTDCIGWITARYLSVFVQLSLILYPSARYLSVFVRYASILYLIARYLSVFVRYASILYLIALYFLVFVRTIQYNINHLPIIFISWLFSSILLNILIYHTFHNRQWSSWCDCWDIIYEFFYGYAIFIWYPIFDHRHHWTNYIT